MKKIHRIASLALLLSGIGLASCGNGASSSSATPTPAPSTPGSSGTWRRFWRKKTFCSPGRRSTCLREACGKSCSRIFPGRRSFTAPPAFPSPSTGSSLRTTWRLTAALFPQSFPACGGKSCWTFRSNGFAWGRRRGKAPQKIFPARNKTGPPCNIVTTGETEHVYVSSTY